MAVLAADVDEALKVMLRGSNAQKIVGTRLRAEEETDQFRPPVACKERSRSSMKMLYRRGESGQP